jgi:uncharacterized protein YndB with AHSA1/START domain
MPDIFHNFPINASAEKVFNGVSTAKGLDNWWTKSSEVAPKFGATYTLDFGPGYTWKAIVTKFEANKEFELQITEADADWLGAKVGFLLSAKGNNLTDVNFYNTGWPTANEHYKISSYCWAMYLRILKRYLEFGEQVPYEKRLSV